jgi:hypothetical protein
MAPWTCIAVAAALLRCLMLPTADALIDEQAPAAAANGAAGAAHGGDGGYRGHAASGGGQRGLEDKRMRLLHITQNGQSRGHSTTTTAPPRCVAPINMCKGVGLATAFGLTVEERLDVSPSAVQVSAVEQAVGLLGQSLRDMKAASRAMLLSGPDQVAAVSAAVSATDSRADEVSRMARWGTPARVGERGILMVWSGGPAAALCGRHVCLIMSSNIDILLRSTHLRVLAHTPPPRRQLLGVLRAFPRRGGAAQDHDTVKGESEKRRRVHAWVSPNTVLLRSAPNTFPPCFDPLTTKRPGTQALPPTSLPPFPRSRASRAQRWWDRPAAFAWASLRRATC